MPNFAATVADLLATCPSPPPPAAAPELPSPFVEASIHARALAGDELAQAELSYLLIEKAAAASTFRPDLVDAAIDWARLSAASCNEGTYRLASALLFRSGAIAGLGFRQSAEVDAVEAIGLLDELADVGCEPAVTGLLQATQALALHGIGCGRSVPFHMER